MAITEADGEEDVDLCIALPIGGIVHGEGSHDGKERFMAGVEVLDGHETDHPHGGLLDEF